MNRAKCIALVLAVLCWVAVLLPVVPVAAPPASGAFRFIPDDGGDPDDVYASAPPRDPEPEPLPAQGTVPPDHRITDERNDMRVRDCLRGVITYILVRL